MSRTNQYNEDQRKGRLNEWDSPYFDILNVAVRINLLDTCLNILLNGHYHEKQVWSRIVWEDVWNLEDEEYQLCKPQLSRDKLLFQIIERPYYLTWWVMSDVSRNNMEQYEIMARLVCDSSLLKSTDVRLKKGSIASRFCENCTLGIEKSIKHIVMQCPFFEEDTTGYGFEYLLNDPTQIFLYLMGKHPEMHTFKAMFVFWTISSNHITDMYKRVILGRI